MNVFETITREQAMAYAIDHYAYDKHDFDKCTNTFEVFEQINPLNEWKEAMLCRDYYGMQPLKFEVEVQS